MEKERVVIEDFGDTWSIIDESGGTIESDFTSYKEAEQWAKDNGYKVVVTFNL
jgi:hypothetical protein